MREEEEGQKDIDEEKERLQEVKLDGQRCSLEVAKKSKTEEEEGKWARLAARHGKNTQ